MWYEDPSFFPVLHLIFPFLLALYWQQDVWKVLACVYLWESLEHAYFTWFDHYPFVGASETFEPCSNSLLLDPLQGALGLLLAHASPLPPPPTTTWRFWILAGLLLGPSTVLLAWSVGGVPLGRILFLVTLFVALLCLVGEKILPHRAYLAGWIATWCALSLGDNVVFQTWGAAFACYLYIRWVDSG